MSSLDSTQRDKLEQVLKFIESGNIGTVDSIKADADMVVIMYKPAAEAEAEAKCEKCGMGSSCNSSDPESCGNGLPVTEQDYKMPEVKELVTEAVTASCATCRFEEYSPGHIYCQACEGCHTSTTHWNWEAKC